MTWQGNFYCLGSFGTLVIFQTLFSIWAWLWHEHCHRLNIKTSWNLFWKYRFVPQVCTLPASQTTWPSSPAIHRFHRSVGTYKKQTATLAWFLLNSHPNSTLEHGSMATRWHSRGSVTHHLWFLRVYVYSWIQKILLGVDSTCQASWRLFILAFKYTTLTYKHSRHWLIHF